MQFTFNKFVHLSTMANENEKSEWFEEWFNTPFYHVLYQDRNEEEAEHFVTKLVDYLQIENNKTILDLACGKGRHAVFLNKKGLNVVGADLSVNSIADAKKYENDDLRFIVHDMREIIAGHRFDYVFNLFTSFGYFDTQKDNLKVLQSVHEMLNDGGKVIIDFLNIHKVVANLVKKEVKTIDGIVFNITREFDGKHILKTISFGHTGQSYSYTERVQGLNKEDFEKLLEKSNFKVDAIFGDFNLDEYHAETSDRLILIASKK